MNADAPEARRSSGRSSSRSSGWSSSWSSDGVYLALDTSTRVGSVCVAVGTAVQACEILDKPGAHASELVPTIREVLDRAGVDVSEVTGIVVGSGPGSFTGVRVAAATAKGLCRALEIPLWAVSSLEAGAASLAVGGATLGVVGRAPLGVVGRAPLGAVGRPTLGEFATAEVSSDEMARPRYVLFDARSDRVYAACYVPRDGGLEELIAPHATTIGELLAADLPLCNFVGDGAHAHSDQIVGAGFPVLPAPAGTPSAEGLVALVGRSPARAPVGDVARWEPDYLRPSSAERLAASKR